MKLSDLRTLIASIPTSADTFDVMFAAPAISPGQNLVISESVEIDSGDVGLTLNQNPVVNRAAMVLFKPQ